MKMPSFGKSNSNGANSTKGRTTLSEEDSRLLVSIAQAIQLANTNFQLAFEQVCRKYSKDPTAYDVAPTPGQVGRIDLIEKQLLMVPQQLPQVEKLREG